MVTTRSCTECKEKQHECVGCRLQLPNDGILLSALTKQQMFKEAGDNLLQNASRQKIIVNISLNVLVVFPYLFIFSLFRVYSFRCPSPTNAFYVRLIFYSILVEKKIIISTP